MTTRTLGALLAAAAVSVLEGLIFQTQPRALTRKQAVNHVRQRFGATDPKKFHVRSRVVRGERRIEIHRRGLLEFWGRPHPSEIHRDPAKRMLRRRYGHLVSTGQVLVLASRHSWDHAARQSGRLGR